MAAARKAGSLIPSWPPVFSSSLPDAQYDETLKDIRKNETEPFKGHNLLHKFMSNLIHSNFHHFNDEVFCKLLEGRTLRFIVHLKDYVLNQ